MAKNSSRISRDGLVKQFDQIVLQEIKNHNDSITSTNVFLQELRLQMSALLASHAKQVASQENRFKKVENEVSVLRGTFDDLLKKVTRKIEQNTEYVINYKHDSDRKLESLEESYVETDKFLEIMDSLKIEMHGFKEELSNHKVYIHSSIKSLEFDLLRSYGEFKEELLNRPSDFIEIKAELEKKLDASIIDAKGVLRRLSIVSKESFILEKKIEQIYTLISRLEKKVG
jgi:hypothetical protein